MGIFNLGYRYMEQWLTDEPAPAGFPLSDFQRLRHEIKPCDVVLVEGHSRVAHVIRTITQSRWSHAALYIGRLHDVEDPLTRQKIKAVYDGQPDTQLIIESQLGLGTVIRPLHIYENRHLRICRPRELAYADAQSVMRYAANRLGTDYDIRAILDLARFYLPWSILPRRWRSSLLSWQSGNCTKTVCSTMIAEAFGFIYYPILPLVKRRANGQVQMFHRNPKLCTPSDFDYSPYFDIIKYPFFDYSERSDPRYRLMPWSGEVKLTKNEAQEYVADQKAFVSPETRPKHRRRIHEKDNLKDL